MNGTRLVHDTLEARGWDVLIADAQRVKRLAPLACRSYRIDAPVLAELSFWDLVPAIWLPTQRSGASASSPVSACIWFAFERV
jgi:transposase